MQAFQGGHCIVLSFSCQAGLVHRLGRERECQNLLACGRCILQHRLVPQITQAEVEADGSFANEVAEGMHCLYYRYWLRLSSEMASDPAEAAFRYSRPPFIHMQMMAAICQKPHILFLLLGYMTGSFFLHLGYVTGVTVFCFPGF